MELNQIKPAAGSKRPRKRVGRGIGSGLGKTAGRGHKGQKARAGGFHKVGFEGGQMPLQRRLPKRGFTNNFATEYLTINVGELDGLKIDGLVDLAALKKVGRLSGSTTRLKVLGEGELTKALTIKADAFSKGAITKIQAAGGTVQVIERPRRPKRFPKKVKA